MLSGSVSVAVTGKPTRGCRVERVDYSAVSSMLVTLTITACSSVLPFVSVTTTITSYALFRARVSRRLVASGVGLEG